MQMRNRAAERRRNTKIAQKPQKGQMKLFGFFFCDFCETFAASAFGCPSFLPQS